MNAQQLTGAESTIYKATVNFCLSQGMSQEEAESWGWRKVESMRKMKKDKSIVRF